MAELLHAAVFRATRRYTFEALPRQSSTAGRNDESILDSKALSSNALCASIFRFDTGMEDALAPTSVIIPPRAKIAAPVSAPAGVSGAPLNKKV